MSRAAVVSFFFPERGAVRPRPFALVALAGLVLGAALATSPIGQRLEWQLYDQFLKRHAIGSQPAPGIVVVAIDELSFSEIGMAWPWPRSLHATLVDQLARSGARTIVFDVIFDTPGAVPGDDEEFAAAIARAGNVVLAADEAVIEDPAYAVTQWSEPTAPLARAARAVGAVRIPYDPDGVLRRARLEFDGRPSLALATAALDPSFDRPTGLEATAPRLFRFNGPPRHGVATVSYYQALDAARLLPAGVFKDKYVWVGRSLAATVPDATADHFMTPVAVQMAGVEVHATVLDALLRDGFIRDPFAAMAGYLALAAVIAAAASIVFFLAGPAAGALAAVAIVAGLMGAGYAALAGGVRVPAVGPSLALAGAYLTTSAYRFALGARERRLIRRAFQHYVAPAIVERMLSDPSQLKLGGELYEVTVLFSDLEGFTTMAERLAPGELSAHLGEYFREMLDVLLPHHGTLDKLIGDSIMMYFGCPIPDPAHAVNACRGALAMQRRMDALNEQWTRRSLPRLRTRVGINTGTVVAGNMGTTTIFNYTILGDCVNLASRLESANKEYGSSILVGEETWGRVRGEFEGRELDSIRVRGRAAPLAIFELAAEAGALAPLRRDVFRWYADGLACYRGGRWADAATSFERALALDPADGPSRRLLERCEEYRRQPPENWDGVHAMH